jgi:hypothetical protein
MNYAKKTIDFIYITKKKPKQKTYQKQIAKKKPLKQKTYLLN